jgi:hypothetical protein
MAGTLPLNLEVTKDFFWDKKTIPMMYGSAANLK